MEETIRKRILVVDDDKEFLEEFCESLRASGYEVMGIDNPVNFFATASRTNPDLIFLDFKMPFKTGFELLVSMDYFPGYSRVPVIVMSAYFQEGSLTLFDKFDVKGCLKKPFHIDDAIFHINEAVKETNAS